MIRPSSRRKPSLSWLPGAVALVLAWAGVAAAQPAAPGALQARPRTIEVPYTQFTLPNGLNVILHEDRTVPVVSVNVWYAVGSGHEKPGRTGFAHLFEHLMFMGSGHVAEGAFDRLLEASGGNNNGSTTPDRTNYWIDVPSNALELALFLESDRMGYLLQAMSPATVDAQRDVVKNERRQSYENRPYGMASIVLDEMLYPKEHPYHWPTIGYMEDLSAASYEDVVEFFKKYYAPNNASLSIAGDIDVAATRKLVERYFGEIGRGAFVEPLAPPAAYLTSVQRRTLLDKVQLPRLYLAWHSPALLAPGDAALDAAASVLAAGKNSRLYRRLVYDMQIAQDVMAMQASQALGSAFLIVATPRPGHTLDEVQKVIDEELDRLREAPPTDRELERVVNQAEASFYARMEQVGSFGGKADQLNAYYTQTGNPDYFAEDLARYRALSPSDVQAVVRRFLPPDRRVELRVEPEKK
ncbi:MAG TPA: pitrilysin family protein [Vicinamibacterales bacterium]|nr:pitrilysin family protein [Vicinamibacterales bacterium]